MNSKKAKLFRSVGKVDKRSKKLYNELNHQEKKVLGEIYKVAKQQITET
jgi:hypothetical protein